jgi:hypothetical protein
MMTHPALHVFVASVAAILLISVPAARSEVIRVDNAGNLKMNKQVWLNWRAHVDANRRNVPAREFLFDVSGMLTGRDGTPLPNAAQIEKNIEFALKEWLKSTNAPVDGGTNKNETGKPSMASGNAHGDTLGKTFRGMSQDEKNALKNRYGTDSLGFRKAGAGETPDIKFSWDYHLARLPAGMAAEDLGFMDPVTSETKVNGSVWGAYSKLATKTQALIVLRGPDSDYFKRGNRKDRVDPASPWNFVDVTGKDINRDYIRNSDASQPPDSGPGTKGQYDFYSVIKHEIGHAVSFKHDGGTRLKSLDPDDHSWVDPKQIPLPIPPTPELGVTPTRGDFEPHASRLFISADLPGGFGGNDLWVVEFDVESGAWLFPQNLGPSLNSPFDERDPHLADDNHTLLFSSNRTGGTGGYDLYQGFFDLTAENWITEALTPLNTTFDEVAPYYKTGQDQLFFASDRSLGCGGFDIYSSVWQLVEPGDGFLPSTNLGCSINSNHNDRDPAVSTYTQALYFASDRPEGPGGFDLYQALFEQPGLLGIPTLLAGLNSPGNELDPSFGLDDQFLYFAGCSDDGCHAHEAENESVPEPSILVLSTIGFCGALRYRFDSHAMRRWFY